jgi:hypothetical protein
MKNKHQLLTASFILSLIINIIELSGQSPVRQNQHIFPRVDKNRAEYKISKPAHLKNEAPGLYSTDDWTSIIDATWGEGLPTTQKLEIFDRAWNYVDQGYGAFMNLDVDINALRDLYRPEIEAGVSRGRFTAIMNYFSMSLLDVHTLIVDESLNWGTPLEPGVPLFVIGASTNNAYFGACVTPLPDSSLLVYKALPNHRLGIQAGDILLGYDGVAWKDLYKQLWDAQLPILPVSRGSTTESMTHTLLQSAGFNWHLFDTIDIIKHTTGDTLHFATSLLRSQQGYIFGNEQLEIPGVSFPDINNDDYISWGKIDGTSIGYIYVWSWYWWLDVSEQFYEAVYELMFNHETTGLIIDFRLNYGGTMEMAHAGYFLLFNETLTKVSFDVRGDPNDHLDMLPSQTHTTDRFVIVGDPNTFYDKPIAVLTGPNAVSNGDWESVRMQFHPMVRTFGKSTNGAFTPNDEPDLGHPDWYFTRANGSGYLIEGHQYMAHIGAHIDEEVWLTQDDVAKGEDTVVKAAMHWLSNTVYAHNITTNRRYVKPESDSIGVNTSVENLNNQTILLKGMIYNNTGEVKDSILFYDDGNHNDGYSDDGLWGTFWYPGSEELHYSFQTKLTDTNSGTTRHDYNITKFTTVGPVVVDSYVNVSADTLINPGDVLPMRLILKNNGLNTTATNISIEGGCLENVITNVAVSNNRFENISPGETKTSNGMFVIYFADNFDGGREIGFWVDIYSDNYMFWRDTFYVFIHSTDIIENDAPELPHKYSFSQNYPNPFNSLTMINYQLPENSLVTIKIYNTIGQEVKTLIHNNQQQGTYTIHWNGKDDMNRAVPSGIYFYRMEADGFSQVKKMLLLE